MKELFLPLSFIYDKITRLRNYLYDVGFFKQYCPTTFTIAVGNISTGGTGKSPMICYLVDNLKEQYSIAILSRGYGRKTKGFREVVVHSNAIEVGDEPLMFKNRYKDRIKVFVDEDRSNGIKNINDLHPDVDLILLDDAFQHRSVKANYYILLSDYQYPFYIDRVLPYGNLRENQKGVSRANAIVVTKCPINLSSEEQEQIRSKINPLPHQELAFSYVNYSDKLIGKRDISRADLVDYNVLLLTGIANPEALISFVSKRSYSCKTLVYRDHYNFSSKDINQILEAFDKIKGKKIILTTEKDYMRLKKFSDFLPEFFYLPIEIKFFQSIGIVKNNL